MGRQISSGAGTPTGQVGIIGIVGRAATGSYFARRVWLRSGCPYDRVKVPIDLPAFINALGPNDRIRFVGVKFARIIGEKSS
jgi:hypothetical protein